jgi:hypothetical protein
MHGTWSHWQFKSKAKVLFLASEENKELAILHYLQIMNSLQRPKFCCAQV